MVKNIFLALLMLFALPLTAIGADLTASINPSASLDTGLEFASSNTIVRLGNKLTDKNNAITTLPYSALGLGTSTAYRTFYPRLYKLANNKFRTYYTVWNGSDDDILYYVDTTDTNLPTSSNLDTPVEMFGGALNEISHAEIVDLGSAWRLYYAYDATGNEGSYWQLAYKDTTDKTDYPNASNLGAQTLLGIGNRDVATSGATAPRIFRKPDNSYRLYYMRLTDSAATSGLYYRDTTDTNPPNADNKGSEVELMALEAGGNEIFDIVRNMDNTYRLYLNFGGALREFYYTDTSDTNLPSTSNITPLALQSNTLGANSVGHSLYSHRILIPASEISASAGAIRIRLQGTTLGEASNLSAVYVGHQASSGNAWDFDGTQVQVLFSGSGSVTVAVNQTLWSDRVVYALDETKNLIVAFDIANDSANDDLRVNTSATGYANYWKASAGNEASQTAPSGYGTVSNRTIIATGIRNAYTDLGIGGSAANYAQLGHLKKIEATGLYRLYFCSNQNLAAGVYDLRYVDQNIDTYSSSPTGTEIFLVDSSSESTQWNFSGDAINNSGTGSINFQWSVDNGVRSWNGSWLTEAQLAGVATQTGRYKALKGQFVSDGSQSASITEGSFRTGTARRRRMID